MPAKLEVRWSVVDSNSVEPGAKVVLLKVQSQKSDNARESPGARALHERRFTGSKTGSTIQIMPRSTPRPGA